MFLPSSSSLGTSGPTPKVDQEAASFSSRSGIVSKEATARYGSFNTQTLWHLVGSQDLAQEMLGSNLLANVVGFSSTALGQKARENACLEIHLSKQFTLWVLWANSLCLGFSFLSLRWAHWNSSLSQNHLMITNAYIPGPRPMLTQ